MPVSQSLEFWNEDLGPTPASHRHWTAYSYVAPWIGMVLCTTGYMLGAGLIDQGFSAWQGIGMILAGNVVVLIPMLLNGHAVAKYAVPVAVLGRASFGTQGAKLRALVACGLFGIQCWVGGSAIYAIGNLASGGALVSPKKSWIGINGPRRMKNKCSIQNKKKLPSCPPPESVRWIESITAPIKSFALRAAKRIKSSARPSDCRCLWPASHLSASRSPPPPLLYGKAIWNPVDLAGQMEGIAVAICLAMIIIYTLCVNLAANVVGPAYVIFPRNVNFAIRGCITAVVGIAIMPWKLIELSDGYTFTWLRRATAPCWVRFWAS